MFKASCVLFAALLVSLALPAISVAGDCGGNTAVRLRASAGGNCNVALSAVRSTNYQYEEEDVVLVPVRSAPRKVFVAQENHYTSYTNTNFRVNQRVRSNQRFRAEDNGATEQRGLINVSGGILGAVLGLGNGGGQNTNQRGIINLK